MKGMDQNILPELKHEVCQSIENESHNSTILEDCFVSDNSLESNENEDIERVGTRSSKVNNSSEFILPSQPPSPPKIRPAAPSKCFVEF